VLEGWKVVESGRWADLRDRPHGRLRALLDAEGSQWSMAAI